MINLEVMTLWAENGCECGTWPSLVVAPLGSCTLRSIKREMRMVTTGVRALAIKVGCSRTMVSWVLSGKRNANTPLGRRIMRLASQTK